MGLEKVQRNEHLFLKNFCDKRNVPLPQSRFMPTLQRKNNGSALLPLVKNKREYKYDTHCTFRVRQWVEIVAEETTPQHLSGGYKPEEDVPNVMTRPSYARAAAMAQKSLLTT